MVLRKDICLVYREWKESEYIMQFQTVMNTTTKLVVQATDTIINIRKPTKIRDKKINGLRYHLKFSVTYFHIHFTSQSISVKFLPFTVCLILHSKFTAFHITFTNFIVQQTLKHVLVLACRDLYHTIQNAS